MIVDPEAYEQISGMLYHDKYMFGRKNFAACVYTYNKLVKQLVQHSLCWIWFMSDLVPVQNPG